ncbi:hypothetical protein A6P39_018165 [Streptomyces sp. FXJ1.172]|uniref:hypothetical protein n=1 Tax=Streptomyces sp. FXJ1.172 TaxID=710705 RepID=UPI0007CFBDA3|nr:hypothetical protein [Streptomyces sp. FXJ1.172]WEO95803.1 hypothetical protein A6P39_018165 [Streptomyces sp. FXJ1.172]
MSESALSVIPSGYRDLLDTYDDQGDGLPAPDITTLCCTTATSLDSPPWAGSVRKKLRAGIEPAPLVVRIVE